MTGLCYTNRCLDEQKPGAFCFSNAVAQHNTLLWAKRPLSDGIYVPAVRLGNDGKFGKGRFAMSSNYIKFYASTLNDYTISRLSDSDWRKYVELYLSCNDEGYLPDLSIISEQLMVPQDDLRKSVAVLKSAGLLIKIGPTWKIARFDAEQKPENDWRDFKNYVFKRDEVCVYCGAKPDHLDHIIPRSKGGQSTPENLVASCSGCNLSKNDRDVSSWYCKQSFYTSERWSYILNITQGKADTQRGK